MSQDVFIKKKKEDEMEYRLLSMRGKRVFFICQNKSILKLAFLSHFEVLNLNPDMSTMLEYIFTRDRSILMH